MSEEGGGGGFTKAVDVSNSDSSSDRRRSQKLQGAQRNMARQDAALESRGVAIEKQKTISIHERKRVTCDAYVTAPPPGRNRKPRPSP